MSNTLPWNFYYVIFLSFVGVFFTLYLQLRTYARARHPSLALLATSSILGLIGLSCTSAPVFFGVLGEYRGIFSISAALLLTLQVPLGLMGTNLLFNSYIELARRKGPE